MLLGSDIFPTLPLSHPALVSATRSTPLFPFDGRAGRKYASACAPEKVV